MKKTLRTNIVMNDSYDTKLCYTTQSSVIQTIHCNVGLKYLLLSLCMHISLIFHKVL